MLQDIAMKLTNGCAHGVRGGGHIHVLVASENVNTSDVGLGVTVLQIERNVAMYAEACGFCSKCERAVHVTREHEPCRSWRWSAQSPANQIIFC